MPYPTLQQYNEALQYPSTALSDPILKNGQVKKTGLGLPLAMCGGFALTYTINIGPNKYAVRCFQKETPNLQQRYLEISNKLRTLHSDYFVNVDFQPQGVQVSGRRYPILRMEWAKGETLGEYLEKNYRNPNVLNQLLTALHRLSQFLETQNIAHGDIQPGNVMVNNGAGLSRVQLIDYDGMYIESLHNLGSSELGLRNFQHPGRNSNCWDATLDRFSFIALNLALRALTINPSLWEKTQSDSETILFTGNDYSNPERSAIFAELLSTPQLTDDARNFAKICKSSFSLVPTLTDYLNKKNIPETQIAVKETISYGEAPYYPSYPVLDATNYYKAGLLIGQRVELIGKITEVKIGRDRYSKPYIFINFGNWRNDIIKLAIWSESVQIFNTMPNETWENRWVSVVGLLENPYTSERFSYTHISINITQSNEIRFISQAEAKRRLSSPTGIPQTNRMRQEAIEGFRRQSAAGGTNVPATQPNRPAVTNNQQIIQQMRNTTNIQKPQTTQPTTSQATKPTTRQTTPLWSQTPKNSTSDSQGKQSGKVNNCFIATALYGENGEETKILREYRDHKLLNSWVGRRLVSGYYRISPSLVPIILHNKHVNIATRTIIGNIVRSIQNRIKTKQTS